MRTLVPALAVLVLVSVVHAQNTASSGAKDKTDNAAKTEKTDKAEKNLTKVATLVGCVERGSAPNRFTLSDPDGSKYQLSGSGLGRYVGQRVQLVGTPDTARLRITGGLLPNPNVAAQAGDIDPVQAAIAAAPGGTSAGTGDAQLPRFKVKSVQEVSGGCK